jgi:hypothetical protein
VFPGAKVIHILRDGRDVAVSKRFHLYRSRSFFLGDERSRWLTRLHSWSRTRHLVFRLRKRFGWFGGDAFWSPDSGRPFFHRRILEMLAGDWRRIVDYLLAREAESPERFLTVRYEELLADPELWIGRLLEFLDVVRDPETVGKIAEATSFRSMSKGKAGFFRGGRSGDWRDKFTPRTTSSSSRSRGGRSRQRAIPLKAPEGGTPAPGRNGLRAFQELADPGPVLQHGGIGAQRADGGAGRPRLAAPGLRAGIAVA